MKEGLQNAKSIPTVKNRNSHLAKTNIIIRRDRLDFNKLLGKTQQSKIISPVEIFNNLDKDEDKAYLWPGQETILEEWDSKNRNKRDNIVKLHTGQGKTLIGLLMLQSLLNEGNGPALYLCPDNTLVKQTVGQADAFGIKTIEVSKESTALPREFLNSEAILITNCQKLFNGKSVFGVEGTSKEIKEVGAVVIDDAHRCLEIIRNAFSIRSNRYIKQADNSSEDNPIFSELLSLFSESLKNQAAGKYDDIIEGHDETSIPVPYWVWYDNLPEVMKIISENKHSDEIKFSWNLIKDQLENCTCIFSGRRVEIVPRLVPINLIPSFSEAKRRIFLSATLTEDAFLIKDLDLDPDCVLNPLTDSSLKHSGERLIILPTLVDPSLKREDLIAWLLGLPKRYGNFGFFTIVPSYYLARPWGRGIPVTSSNFEETLKSLKERIRDKKAFESYILINKYDGIDLPGHICRILCLDSLPSYDALIDRYYQSVMPSTAISQRKLAQRIEQGIGRAIRGVSDYCIVIIIGTDISAFFSENAKRDYLSNEAQRQIKIGEELAGELKKEGPALTSIESLIEKVLSRDLGWKTYYKDRMNDVEIKPINPDFIQRAALERKAELCYQNRQYPQATSVVQDIINSLENDKKELGWYLQLKATYEYPIDIQKSLEIQLTAFNTNSRLSRPPKGVQYTKLTREGINRAQRISEYIKSKDSPTHLILEVENILDKLTFEISSDVFEDGIDALGQILGYKTDRPEKKTGKGPDNLWQIDNSHYWIIECKNRVIKDRGISKSEAGQMDTSIGWFEEKYENCENIPIIVHPSNKFMGDAFSTKQLYSLQPKNLEKLKSNVKGFYKFFSGQPSSSISPEAVKSKIKEYSLEIKEIKTTILSKISK